MTSTPTTINPGTDAWVDGCDDAGAGVWVDADTGARTAVDGHVEAVSGGCADADADADAEAEAEAWASADAVPSAEQLAGWFAHPSAALDDTDPDALAAESGSGFGPHLDPLGGRVVPGHGQVEESVGPSLWDGHMTSTPTTHPGGDAWVDGCADAGLNVRAEAHAGAEAWADAGAVPSAQVLAEWFAHPSAVLDEDSGVDGWLRPAGQSDAAANRDATALADPDALDATPALNDPTALADLDAMDASLDDPDALNAGASLAAGAALGDSAAGAAGGAGVVPGWVEAEWLEVPVRSQVRALLGLSPGPGLLVALAGLAAGPCPDPHTDRAVPGRPVPGSAPGFACSCQVVVTAAWDAMATWTGTCAAVQLVDIAGSELVTVLPQGAPVAARTLCVNLG